MSHHCVFPRINAILGNFFQSCLMKWRKLSAGRSKQTVKLCKKKEDFKKTKEQLKLSAKPFKNCRCELLSIYNTRIASMTLEISCLLCELYLCCPYSLEMKVSAWSWMNRSVTMRTWGTSMDFPCLTVFCKKKKS